MAASAALLLRAVVVVAALAAGARAQSNNIIGELINSRYTQFVSLVETAGLTDDLRTVTTRNIVTIFIPTNNFLSKTVAQTQVAFLKTNLTLLRRVITFHVLPQRLTSAQFTNGSVYTALSGDPVHISIIAGRIIAELSPVRMPDAILAPDGVGHGLNGLLIPPAVASLVVAGSVSPTPPAPPPPPILGIAPPPTTAPAPVGSTAPPPVATAPPPLATAPPPLAPGPVTAPVPISAPPVPPAPAPLLAPPAAQTPMGTPLGSPIPAPPAPPTPPGVPAVAPTPPTSEFSNLVAALNASGNYSTLLTLLNATGLTSEIMALTTKVTLLAPTNDAFAAVPVDVLYSIRLHNQIMDVLLYHVIMGYYTNADFQRLTSRAVAYPTLATGNLTVNASVVNNTLTFEPGSANDIDPDVFADGTISVQGINKVLLNPAIVAPGSVVPVGAPGPNGLPLSPRAPGALPPPSPPPSTGAHSAVSAVATVGTVLAVVLALL